MAYEGLDVPEVAVIAALTHIRYRPGLEQVVARAPRVDLHAGPYETQPALVFHPYEPRQRPIDAPRAVARASRVWREKPRAAAPRQSRYAER